MLYIVVIMGIFILFTNLSNNESNMSEPTKADKEKGADLSLPWQQRYITIAKLDLDSYNSDVSDTEYYDYDNPIIDDVAITIAANSQDPKEAIEKTIKYVYNNVDYVVGESDSNCFDKSAPEVLSSEYGQCDTQSMVVLAILRRMGIAAKPVAGCVFSAPTCNYQSIYLNSLQDLGLAPRFNELTDEELEGEVFSRADLTSRKGGLHAWAMAWLPETGWLHIESTTGKLADIDCYNYHVELFPDDDNKKEFCVSTNYAYAKACQLNDLAILNKQGLGLVQEVSP